MHGICTAYAQGMNHRVKQLEEEMEEIRNACEKWLAEGSGESGQTG
jgi:hypothetical protein